MPEHRWSRSRAMLKLMLAAALVAGSVNAYAKPDISAIIVQALAVKALPIREFEPAHPERRVFGRLRYRGGIQLSSESPFFGGISGLAVDGDTGRFLAVSDAGAWMRGRIAYRGSAPVGVEDLEIGPMLSREGKPLAREKDRDAEAIALVSGTLESGEALVAFEQNKRVGRFPVGKDGLGAPQSYLPLPKDVQKLVANRSLESVVVLPAGPMKGALVLIAERGSGAGDRPGWVIAGKKVSEFRLADHGGFDVSDLAALPNGDIVVLERRFTWSEGMRMRLRLVSQSELAPGAKVEGEELFSADQTFQIDNMEALAVHTDQRGASVLTIMSDDNFNFFQRTLLLQFSILDADVTNSTDQ
ncbi:MAG: esterase-like activity of phytase family protein [Hyphomicrobiaceae bacterium]